MGPKGGTSDVSSVMTPLTGTFSPHEVEATWASQDRYTYIAILYAILGIALRTFFKRLRLRRPPEQRVVLHLVEEGIL